MECPKNKSDDGDDSELDPRIQIELEKLNTATDEINKLEIELDEANTTFRMLLNESTRRLKLLSKKLGGCIERARPYYEALEIAKKAQIECQRAAVQFQRANEIHAAAKETVALAEQRFMSNQHEWQFDNAWQEMLNHATIKVMDAENQKSESGREHQKRATLFNAAEQKVQELEEKLRRNIAKSRPYFDEKTICQDQLSMQKQRIESVQKAVTRVKHEYAQSLKCLEAISEEIHRKRNGGGKLDSLDDEAPRGPREPGVGAEKCPTPEESRSLKMHLPDFDLELEKCEMRSTGASSSVISEQDSVEMEDNLAELKQRVRELAVRPVEGRCSDDSWESELNATVNKLDHMMLMQECARELSDQYKNRSDCITKSASESDVTKISSNSKREIIISPMSLERKLGERNSTKDENVECMSD